MQSQEKRKLTTYISPATAWAFALGTSVGWGSLVVTSNTYLAQAGPMGSFFGMLAGMLIMLLISKNYAYMMARYPEAGGAYAYCREAFGFDHGFLAAWFLALTYLAVLWANATSLPLFSRYFLGGTFQFGKLYTVFGYDVYLGEALLTILSVLVVGLLCARFKKTMARIMLGLVLLFSGGIVVCFIGAIFRQGGAFHPAYVPDKGQISQIVRIAVISPWAFIGFENISHLSEEYSFRHSKGFKVLLAAVIATTLVYIAVTLLSATAYPPQYDSWLDYIRDIGNLSGIEGLPAFYAARHYLGDFGVGALMLSLLALVLTSLIGNITAMSRLFYALGKDRILPAAFGKLNDKNVPSNAIALVAGVSMLIPFVGRMAIGWIVDVTTLGATLIYGMVSAAAMKTARFRGDRLESRTGLAGTIVMIGFGIYLLVPNLFASGTIETESYFLFVAWAVLGFVYFHAILNRDHHKRFGQSIIVWMALLSLILFVSLVWMSQSILSATRVSAANIEAHYVRAGFAGEGGVVAGQLDSVRHVTTRSIVVVVAVFALSLGVLLNNYSIMSRRAKNSESRLGVVIERANTDALTGVKSKLAYVEMEHRTDARVSAREMEAFAVAVCDVNGLKFINDSRGHKAGDEFIVRASRMICELFSHSPVYRVGGDEFAVVLTGRDFEARDRLVSTLHDQSVANIGTGDVVISCGLSEFRPGEDSCFHTVFQRADERMFAEKRLLKSMGAATR